MEKLKRDVLELWERFGLPVMVVGLIALIIVLLIAGAGIIGTLLTIIILGVVIYFGSLPMLASAFVMGVLLKVLSGDLKRLMSVWFAGPKNEQFFGFVDGTSYIAMVFLFFLAMYAAAYIVRQVCSVIGAFQPIRFKQTIGPVE